MKEELQVKKLLVFPKKLLEVFLRFGRPKKKKMRIGRVVSSVVCVIMLSSLTTHADFKRDILVNPLPHYLLYSTCCLLSLALMCVMSSHKPLFLPNDIIISTPRVRADSSLDSNCCVVTYYCCETELNKQSQFIKVRKASERSAIAYRVREDNSTQARPLKKKKRKKNRQGRQSSDVHSYLHF